METASSTSLNGRGPGGENFHKYKGVQSASRGLPEEADTRT